MAGSLRAVIFDMDDTLFDCTGTLVEASRVRAAEVLVAEGLDATVDEALEMQKDLADKHGPHFLVFDEIARRHDLDEETVERVYRAYNSEDVGDIEPFRDVVPTLRYLRARGIQCFLLTSGVYRRQATKIDRLGLRDEFDDLLINDVERGQMLSECLRYLLEKHSLRPAEALVVGNRPQEEIRVGNDLGTRTARMLHGRFRQFEPRDEREVADYRITRIFQVPTLIALANMNREPDSLRILAMGGGTGLPIVLEGCKAYCGNLTGIVTVTDSGRSSGVLREELGILPPGDARNCLVALSESGPREQLVNELMQFRFSQGSFEGMSLGNLCIAAMVQRHGSFQAGLDALSRLLSIHGRVLPPTEADCHVCAELADGEVREGEFNVRGLDKAPIERLYLKPDAPDAFGPAVDAILNADLIVLGPGSLFTSVLTNVLVPGVREALANTRGKVLYVGNIVTQPGQTDGFQASDHLREVCKYVGEEALDYAVFNTTVPDEKILARYREEGAEMVLPDPGIEQYDVEVIEADLVEDLDGKRVLWEKQDLLRHHPDKLGDAICRVLAGLPQPNGGPPPASGAGGS
jgi:uncharacterized cofD-like protein